ncbi:hypothetical protein UlMin_040618 [Ulmus minor]
MSSSNQKSTYAEKYAAPGPAAQISTGIPVNSASSGYYSEGYQPQAAPIHLQPGVPVPWSTGLFDCFSDFKNCCITCWCPCITFGQIADIVDKGSTSCSASGALFALITCVTGCSCLYSCFYRKKMREQYALEESPCGDCLVHCCCEYCALCQEYRELQNRGYNMQIGWQGNVEEKNRGVAMAPVVEGGMSR